MASDLTGQGKLYKLAGHLKLNPPPVSFFNFGSGRPSPTGGGGKANIGYLIFFPGPALILGP